MIDIHIVLNIVLNYDHDPNQWAKARVLSLHTKTLVDGKAYDKGCFGRSSFLKVDWCTICQKKCPDCVWLRYTVGDTYSFRYIVHCPTWHCRMSALYSMINDYKSSGILLLRVPWQKSKNVNIPRSDGSVTQGRCHNDRVYLRNEQYYICTVWEEDGEQWSKLVPLTHYTDVKPKLLF